MNIEEKLGYVQSNLKAPKGQRNTFGNYNYRSCEDILEAVKPLLAEVKATIRLCDDIVTRGERTYVQATAIFTDVESLAEPPITNTAYAREEESKKGMDASQVTGAASSYARKYALNGLLAIDDTKDSDATNDHGKSDTRPDNKPPARRAPESIVCKQCGKPVSPAKKGNKIVSPEELAHASEAEFGQVMCAKCYMTARKEVQDATGSTADQPPADEAEGTEP